MTTILYSTWGHRRGLSEGQIDETRSDDLSVFGNTTESYWIVPATSVDDPLYEAAYAMDAYNRAHRAHYWLGQYPR